LGNPTMSGAREDGLFAATYYSSAQENQSIDQFVASLRQLSAHPGMESFEVLPPTQLSNGPRPVYEVPVRLAPLNGSGSAPAQELGLLITYHWKR
jgi:hypothetical protein